MKYSLSLLLFLLIPLTFAATLETYEGGAVDPAGFSMSASGAQTLSISKTVYTDSTIPLQISNSIYGFSISGNFNLQTDSATLRVILIDSNDQEYLVFEAYNLLYGQGYGSFNYICEETCLLHGVNPSNLKVEIDGATMDIANAHYITQRPLSPQAISTQKSDNQQSQTNFKIQKLNEKAEGWIAGETEVGNLLYSEKKNLFGGEKLPNLQGFEYYKGGVFSFGKSTTVNQKNLNFQFPIKFDWRDRHGKSWIPNIESQGHCGACWAFGVSSTVDAVINLYYNRRLNIDMSEQHIICDKKGSCVGGAWPQRALNLFKNEGIVEENCMYYSARDDDCDRLCNEWQKSLWKIEDYHLVLGSDDSIKKALIEHGPLTFATAFWDGRSMEGSNYGNFPDGPRPWANHAMSLIGYETGSLETIWIVKNSWGRTWGQNGYGYIQLPFIQRWSIYWIEHPYLEYDPDRFEVRCEDKDGDNYCNWGIIGDKPVTCPENCLQLKDCDDSNPHFGPYSDTFECIEITSSRAGISVKNDSKGCCVNPYSEACVISTKNQCCPDEGYGVTKDLGPISREECESHFFYPSESAEACVLMDLSSFPNANFCNAGCCCTRFEDSKFSFPLLEGEEKIKAQCLNDYQRWYTYQEVGGYCSNWECGNIASGIASTSGTLYGSHPIDEFNRPLISSAIEYKGTVGEELMFRIEATGAKPITFLMLEFEKPIPNGVEFNPITGVFKWTPKKADVFTFKVVAQNKNGYDSELIQIDIFDNSPAGNNLMWGLILAGLALFVAIIGIAFYGLIGFVAGFLGLAGLWGMIISGVAIILAAPSAGFILGWILGFC